MDCKKQISILEIIERHPYKLKIMGNLCILNSGSITYANKECYFALRNDLSVIIFDQKNIIKDPHGTFFFKKKRKSNKSLKKKKM